MDAVAIAIVGVGVDVDVVAVAVVMAVEGLLELGVLVQRVSFQQTKSFAGTGLGGE